MFFIPLSQVESVELVIHALRAAGGQADCSTCPARRVCMKQCLTIADTIGQMVQNGTLPCLDTDRDPPPQDETPAKNTPQTKSGRGGLKIVK